MRERMLDKDQQDVVNKGRDPSFIDCGPVEDLLHGRLDGKQMRVVSWGRAIQHYWFGPIEDLLDGRFTGIQMELISLGRGTNLRYANIDDLGPEVPASIMEMISQERANAT